MEDMLKTVNKIAAQSIPKVHKGNMKGHFIREVLDINGMYVIVKNGNSPIEPPSNRYGAFLDKPHVSDGFKRLLKQGVRIDAKVKLVNHKWEVLELRPEPIKPNTDNEQELQAQKKEYEDFNNY